MHQRNLTMSALSVLTPLVLPTVCGSGVRHQVNNPAKF